MSRETSPYIVGDFWLDQRRDGKSPGIWQIARYAEQSRSVVYRSTRKRSVELAKPVIHAHVEAERAKSLQPVEDAEAVPQLLLYWKEHGQHTRKPGTIATSLRAFIGFLMQDHLGTRATIADLKPVAFDHFRRWRMQEHSFHVPWGGKAFPVDSQGVSGEAVQRNLDDERAALNRAARNGRIPYAPKVPSVPTHLRSPARDVRVTLPQLGAMLGFAQAGGLDDGGSLRLLLLLTATACRPEAALAFDPRAQWHGATIDMHPPEWPRTKKRNPVLPTIRPMRLVLRQWQKDGASAVLSRRIAWRTMRRALGLPAAVIPKTIRHTIATEMPSRGVPAEQISGILGHTAMDRTTEVYAKYAPAYLAEARRVLTTIFVEVLRHRRRWLADHLRTEVGKRAGGGGCEGRRERIGRLRRCRVVRALSSAGRAARLHRVGRRFEPVSAHHRRAAAPSYPSPTQLLARYSSIIRSPLALSVTSERRRSSTSARRTTSPRDSSLPRQRSAVLGGTAAPMQALDTGTSAPRPWWM